MGANLEVNAGAGARTGPTGAGAPAAPLVPGLSWGLLGSRGLLGLAVKLLLYENEKIHENFPMQKHPN